MCSAAYNIFHANNSLVNLFRPLQPLLSGLRRNEYGKKGRGTGKNSEYSNYLGLDKVEKQWSQDGGY